MWIYLAFLLRPGSWSVVMCDDSIVLPSGGLAVISFEIIAGAIVVVVCVAMFIFTPESAIARMLLPG